MSSYWCMLRHTWIFMDIMIHQVSIMDIMVTWCKIGLTWNVIYWLRRGGGLTRCFFLSEGGFGQRRIFAGDWFWPEGGFVLFPSIETYSERAGRDVDSMVDNEHLKCTATLPLYITSERAISKMNFFALLLP